MAIELKMPALSPTMEKGTLAKWLVAEGDIVKPGDLLAEIETDKATMEFEAADPGRIARLLVRAGSEDVIVGTVIALLADPDSDGDEVVAGDERPATIASAPLPADALTPARQRPADRIKVSPLAQRIADAKGMDLGGVTGSGPGGRIVRADLGIASSVPPSPAQEMPARSDAVIAPPPRDVPVETMRLDTLRRTIARRLSESKQNVPHFYLTARCNLDPMLRLRTELNASLAPRGIKLSVNDMMIKAMGLALAEVPEANVQFGGEVLHRFGRIDISMAVALESGLVTPVIKDVARLSLSEIARVSKSLAEKAREGRLVPEDYQGGTASISNLGMFGIDEMIPVINPPQALILGIGAGVEQPWKIDGGIALATILAATASFDHRAIDGATGARFLQAFREFVENPLRILG